MALTVQGEALVDELMVMTRPAAAQTGIAVVRGTRRVEGLRATLAELRDRVGQSDDMLTSLDWFVSRTTMWNATPVVVLQWVDQVLQSATLLHVRCWHGIGTGVLKCGNLTGDGGVIARPGDRMAALDHAIRALLAERFVHTVIATVRQPDGATPGTDGWQTRDVRCSLDLTGGLDAFLLRQSRKFRRNFRYYRRRAEEQLGCRLLPALTEAQSETAVRSLHGQGDHAVPARRAMLHEAALRNTPGAFAMGLVDRDGAWLSYLAGWRKGRTVFIEWQLNRAGLEGSSLSTVMRALAVEHVAAAGAVSIVFVGGTTGIWAGACTAESCADLLAIRAGPVSRWVTALLASLRPNGQMGLLYAARTTSS